MTSAKLRKHRTTTGSHIAHVDVSVCVCVLLKVIIRNVRFHVCKLFFAALNKVALRAVGFEGSPFRSHKSYNTLLPCE